MNSMTGFGRGKASWKGGQIVTEVRSLNHRFCDVFVRLPRTMYRLEDRIRSYVKDQVSRGRIEVTVSYYPDELSLKEIKVDLGLASAYDRALARLRDELGLMGDWNVVELARFPDVFSVEDKEIDPEDLWPAVRDALEEAFYGLSEMRGKEGERLLRDIEGKLKRIEGLMEEIQARTPALLNDYKERLTNRVKEFLDKGVLEESRLAAEVALFAERIDVSEELVRISSHLERMRSILGQDKPVGRQIDFVIQEIQREINTLSSKAQDPVVAYLAVDVKVELEKIREQAQNIE